MTIFAPIKHLAISTGFYKQARTLHRVLHPDERRLFRAHRALLSSFVKPGDLVFDVGANIGKRTEIFLSLGCHVIAFEPQPMCAREIAAQKSRRLTVIQKAVGENEGSAVLHVMKSNSLSSLLPQWEGSKTVGSIDVEVTTLDRAIEKFGVPQFCKIDVEGFEPQVLRGLSHAIRTISFEYHDDEKGDERTLQCVTLLSARGNYVFNLTAENEADFLCRDWLTIPEFTTSFTHYTAGHPWGDVFAKLVD